MRLRPYHGHRRVVEWEAVGDGAVPGSVIGRSAGYGPAVGDGFAHLLGQGLGELRIGLGAE